MERIERPPNKLIMLLLMLIFLAIIIASIIQLPWSTELEEELSTEDVGNILFHNYWFALIVLGLVLLAALLGGIYLAKIELKTKGEEDAKK